MKLEDGEIIIDEKGNIFQVCPKCNKSVPKIIDNDALYDLRNIEYGVINIETGEELVYIPCEVCGLPIV